METHSLKKIILMSFIFWGLVSCTQKPKEVVTKANDDSGVIYAPDRITSYNVCYTKLLRITAAVTAQLTKVFGRDSSSAYDGRGNP